MTRAKILSVATGVPPYCFQQEEIAERMIEFLQLDGTRAAKLHRLYQNTKIEKRYSVLPDFKSPRASWGFWGSHYPDKAPTTLKRNQLYKEYAPQLAIETAARALQEWGGDPKEISHVISISCTGLMAPGMECLLLKALQLRDSVDRLGINFMGCFGAFKGLSIANSLFQADTKRKILVVCTELCTLHMQADQTANTLIGNSLFADGAAAVVIGEENGKSKGLWEIVNTGSHLIPDTFHEMTWDLGDTGFNMLLSQEVPAHIANLIIRFADEVLDTISPSQCAWAVHPGGKAILEVIQKKGSLLENQLQASWEILRDYGNMSSATFLFVLNKLRTLQTQYPWALGLGFGPGLSVEGILLKTLS